MGPLFDSRKYLRTPTFVKEGLYDGAQIRRPASLPPSELELPPLMAEESDEYFEPDRLGALPNAPPPLPARRSIDLAPPPLPPKVSGLRTALGMAVAPLHRELGDEIRAPGYRRQMQEYVGNRQAQMDRAELAHKAAQTEAQMSTAGANQARRQAELARSGSYGPKPIMQTHGTRVLNPDGTILANEFNLPPKPEPPTFEIGPDRKVKVTPGLRVPANLASTLEQMSGKVDQKYSTLKQEIRDAHPDWDDPQVDAEASRRHRERSEAELARIKRAPAGGSGVTAMRYEDSKNAKSVADAASVAIGKHGGVDKAIEALEATPLGQRDDTTDKVIAELYARKGKNISTAKGKGGRGRWDVGGDKKPTAVPAPKPAVTVGAPAVGTEKGGYRFKGGNPADKNNWEKI